MYSQPSLLPRQDPDAPIRQTDNDAAVARLSAVQKHYLDDLFVKHLVPRAHLQPNRPPLINIGTYIRTRGIEDLVDGWLSSAKKQGKKCQIVSLGAGSDTRFWRIAVSGSFVSGGSRVFYLADFYLGRLVLTRTL